MEPVVERGCETTWWIYVVCQWRVQGGLKGYSSPQKIGGEREMAREECFILDLAPPKKFLDLPMVSALVSFMHPSPKYLPVSLFIIRFFWSCRMLDYLQSFSCLFNRHQKLQSQPLTEAFPFVHSSWAIDSHKCSDCTWWYWVPSVASRSKHFLRQTGMTRFRHHQVMSLLKPSRLCSAKL